MENARKCFHLELSLDHRSKCKYPCCFVVFLLSILLHWYHTQTVNTIFINISCFSHHILHICHWLEKYFIRSQFLQFFFQISQQYKKFVFCFISLPNSDTFLLDKIRKVEKCHCFRAMGIPSLLKQNVLFCHSHTIFQVSMFHSQMQMIDDTVDVQSIRTSNKMDISNFLYCGKHLYVLL